VYNRQGIHKPGNITEEHHIAKLDLQATTHTEVQWPHFNTRERKKNIVILRNEPGWF
jgi:hypothetical protein